jgi:lysophospholipase L1-like esterase
MAAELARVAGGARVHLQSIMPLRGEKAYLNPPVKSLNARIRAIAAERRFAYIDLWPALADEKGELRAEFTTDGCHLTAQGNAAWTKVLEDAVRRPQSGGAAGR